MTNQWEFDLMCRTLKETAGWLKRGMKQSSLCGPIHRTKMFTTIHSVRNMWEKKALVLPSVLFVLLGSYLWQKAFLVDLGFGN